MKLLLSLLWKLPVCALAFLVGMVLSGVLMPLTGMEAPAMPEGTDADTIMAWFLLGSVILALALAGISRGLRSGFVARWLILSALAWGINGIIMTLEAYFFTTTGAASSAGSTLFTILNYLLPSLTLSGAVAWLFRPAKVGTMVMSGQTFWKSRSARSWAWRMGVVVLTYPLVYIIFGLMVNPLIRDYYVQGAYELAAPTWGEIIPLQLVRSMLLLVLCLLPLIAWGRSYRQFAPALGAAVFVLTAFTSVITSYWFPWQLRVYHGLELVADAFVYSAVFVALLAPRVRTAPTT